MPANPVLRSDSERVCDDPGVIFARRLTIALLVAGFRVWRRMPAEDRQRVLSAVPRLASSLSRRRRVRA